MLKQLEPSSRAFHRYARRVECSFGQKKSICSGVVVAVWELFLTGILNIGEATKNDLAKKLNKKGKRLYRRGKVNVPHDVDPITKYIDISSIFTRRDNHQKNIIEVLDQEIGFDTGTTAANIAELGDIRHVWYAESDGMSSFEEIFTLNGFKARDNFALCSAAIGHYITVVCEANGFWLIDGLGTFKFLFYDSYENLMRDLNNYTANAKFNIYSAELIGQRDAQSLTTNFEAVQQGQGKDKIAVKTPKPSKYPEVIEISDSEDEKDKFQTPAENVNIFTESTSSSSDEEVLKVSLIILFLNKWLLNIKIFLC